MLVGGGSLHCVATLSPSCIVLVAVEIGVEFIKLVGGGQIYAQALPYADELDLTLIHAEAPEVDTYFPEYEDDFVEVRREDLEKFSFVAFIPKNPRR